MSFSYRDKPRLSDRLRGKSGDEILNELKEELDQDRKMFFETNPHWGTTPSPMTGPFSRAGFPFDDDMMSRGRQDIRSHLEDLAQRHPEFADHLRCPPWGGEVSGARSFGRKRRGSGSGDDEAQSQASGASSSSTEPVMQETDERGRSRPGNLNQHGLRNTVDLGQQQQQQQDSEEKGRSQRSMSAPPDNRAQQPQRYVSRLEINPVNPADPTSGGGPATVTSEGHGKPPVAPKQTQPQPTTKQSSGNVRHIPIFVEGRDEPVLPKATAENVEQVFTSRSVDMDEPFPQSQHGFGRSPFGSQQQFYPQQQTAPQRARGFQQHSAAPPSPKQQRQTKPQAQPQQQPPPKPHSQSPKPPEVSANDPILRVQAVAKDVAELQAQVEKYSGATRKDKDYIYLDEMLTRNLLKLDDIDTAGKDNVRQARKEVIRNIQRCISVLEGKVPIPGEQNKQAELAMDTATEDKSGSTMEVAATSETATEDSKESPPVGLLENENQTDPQQDVKTSEETGAVTKQIPMDVEEQKQDSVVNVEVGSESNTVPEAKEENNSNAATEQQLQSS